MKRMIHYKRIILLICAMFCAFGVLTLQAVAADSNSTLTLHYAHNGAEFSIYRVADITTDGYQLSDDFSDYSVSLPEDGDSGWRDTSATLAAYVALDHLEANASATVSGGSASFASLSDGLYLIIGSVTTDDSYQYTPVSCLVAVSGDTAATVKYEAEEIPDETVYVSYSVIKNWKNDTDQVRPECITVVLLCNATVYDTVVLDEDNNWSYTWDDLDAANHWQLAEVDVPDGYSVSTEQDGTNFTVTNTYTGSSTVISPTKPDDNNVETDESQSSDDDSSTTEKEDNSKVIESETTDTPIDNSDSNSEDTTTTQNAKTGDSSHVYLIAGIAVASIILLSILFAIGKRKKQEN